MKSRGESSKEIGSSTLEVLKNFDASAIKRIMDNLNVTEDDETEAITPHTMNLMFRMKTEKSETFSGDVISSLGSSDMETKRLMSLISNLKPGERKQIGLFKGMQQHALGLDIMRDAHGKLSLFFVESARMKDQYDLAAKIVQLLKDSKMDFECYACQAGIQRDGGNCGLFTYAILSTLSKEPDFHKTLADAKKLEIPEFRHYIGMRKESPLDAVTWVSPSILPVKAIKMSQSFTQIHQLLTEKKIPPEKIETLIKEIKDSHTLKKDGRDLNVYVRTRRANLYQKLRALYLDKAALEIEEHKIALELALKTIFDDPVGFSKKSREEINKHYHTLQESFDKIKNVINLEDFAALYPSFFKGIFQPDEDLSFIYNSTLFLRQIKASVLQNLKESQIADKYIENLLEVKELSKKLEAFLLEGKGTPRDILEDLNFIQKLDKKINPKEIISTILKYTDSGNLILRNFDFKEGWAANESNIQLMHSIRWATLINALLKTEKAEEGTIDEVLDNLNKVDLEFALEVLKFKYGVHIEREKLTKLQDMESEQIPDEFHKIIRAVKESSLKSMDDINKCLENNKMPSKEKFEQIVSNASSETLWTNVHKFITNNYDKVTKLEAYWLIQWRDTNCPPAYAADLLRNRIEEGLTEVQKQLKNPELTPKERKKMEVGIKIFQEIKKQQGHVNNKHLLEVTSSTHDVLLYPEVKHLEKKIKSYEQLANDIKIKSPKLKILAGLMKSFAGILLAIVTFGKKTDKYRSGLKELRTAQEAKGGKKVLTAMKEACKVLREKDSADLLEEHPKGKTGGI